MRRSLKLISLFALLAPLTAQMIAEEIYNVRK